MTDRREAISRLIDTTQANADRAAARGQTKAAARWQAKVGRLLAKD